MRQIYSRTHIPKCNFNEVTLQRYWNRTSTWVFSCKFAVHFQKIFFKRHLWVAASVPYIENNNVVLNIVQYCMKYELDTTL